MKTFILAVFLAASTAAAQPRGKIHHMRLAGSLPIQTCLAPLPQSGVYWPHASVYAVPDTSCPAWGQWQTIPIDLVYFRIQHVQSGLFLTRINGAITLENYAYGDLNGGLNVGGYSPADQAFRRDWIAGSEVRLVMYHPDPNDTQSCLFVDENNRLGVKFFGFPGVPLVERFFRGAANPQPLW